MLGALLALPLICAGAALQWWSVSTYRIPLSSDQTVVGLMAKHIVEGKGHPVFYYGATYGGTLETHLVAAAFAFFGPSTTTFRGVMVGLVWLIIAGVGGLTYRWFGPRASVFATAYLCIPPFFFLYKGLTSDGAYDSVCIVTLIVVATALFTDEAIERRRPQWAFATLLGLASGIGLWVTPVCLVVSAAAVLWLIARKPPRPNLAAGLAATAGFIAGSFPWWFWNLRHSWASAHAAELASTDAQTALGNLLKLLKDALAVLTGVGQPNAGIVPSLPFPWAWLIVPIATVVLLLPTIGKAFRGDRAVRLLFLGLGLLFFAASWSTRFVAVEPRFLVSFYVLFPPLLGIGVAWYLERKSTAVLAVACLVPIFAVNTGSIWFARQHLGPAHDEEVTLPLDQLESQLAAIRARFVYANYWTAYRVTFETGERVIASPIPGEDTVRYRPHLEAVQASKNPAVVLLPPRSTCFERYLRETGSLFQRQRVGSFLIFWDLPQATVETIRRSGSLPMPADAYRASWGLVKPPGPLPAGGSGSATVKFRNEGPCIWMHPVHLAYGWYPLAPSGAPPDESGRVLPNRRIAPGEVVVLDVQLKAPSVPGPYRLVFDLVHEYVATFSSKGGETLALDVAVR